MEEIKLTVDNFEEEAVKSDKPVLIDFWATWCGPCKMLAPIVHDIAEEQKDTVKVCKVDVDEQPALAGMFNVSSIPTLVFMKNGEVVNRTVGYMSKQRIDDIINRVF